MRGLKFFLVFILTLPVSYASSMLDTLKNPFSALLELLSFSFIAKSEYISATKVAIFFIVFAIIYTALNFGLRGGTTKGAAFDTGDKNQNKKLSGIIAFAFATISILFIPNEIVRAIGEMYSAIIALLLLGLPAGIIAYFSFMQTKDMNNLSLKHGSRGFALLLISTLISTIYEEYAFTNVLNETMFGLPAGIIGIWAIIELGKAIWNIKSKTKNITRKTLKGDPTVTREPTVNVTPNRPILSDVTTTPSNLNQNKARLRDLFKLKSPLEKLLDKLILLKDRLNELKVLLTNNSDAQKKVAAISKLDQIHKLLESIVPQIHENKDLTNLEKLQDLLQLIQREVDESSKVSSKAFGAISNSGATYSKKQMKKSVKHFNKISKDIKTITQILFEINPLLVDFKKSYFLFIKWMAETLAYINNNFTDSENKLKTEELYSNSNLERLIKITLDKIVKKAIIHVSELISMRKKVKKYTTNKKLMALFTDLDHLQESEQIRTVERIKTLNTNK